MRHGVFLDWRRELIWAGGVSLVLCLGWLGTMSYMNASTAPPRITRVLGESRSLALAIQSRAQDYGHYGPGRFAGEQPMAFEGPFLDVTLPGPQQLPWGTEVAWLDMRCLTTPVSYISSFYLDPFNNKGKNIRSQYRYGSADLRKYGLIVGYGPDRAADVQPILFRNEAGYGSRIKTLDEFYQSQYVYDPTNGLKSRGDIFRVLP